MKKIKVFLSLLIVVALVSSITVAGVTQVGAVSPTSIKLNYSSLTIGIGEVIELETTCIPRGSSSTVKYTSSDSNIAKVGRKTGRLTAYRSGTVTVTAKSANGKTSSCKVTVKKPPNFISLNKSNISLGVGEQFVLKYTLPSGTSSFDTQFSSLNTKVVTVDKVKGTMTAKSAGTARVAVRTYNGKIAYCNVTVKKAATSGTMYLTYKVNGNKYTAYPAEKKTYEFQVSDKTVDYDIHFTNSTYSYHVDYTSSNDKVASIKKAGGIMTIKAAGTATIKATAFNGQSITVSVKVTDPNQYVSPQTIYPYTKHGQIVGYLNYSRVGTNVPIHLGADQSDVDSYSVCMHQVNSGYYLFSGTAPLLLLGHNNRCLGGIVNSQVGDTFTVNASYGGTYKYKVTYKGLIYVGNSNGVMTMYDVNTGKQMLETATSGHAAIQMSTCAAGYPSNYRWLVKADRISGPIVKEN